MDSFKKSVESFFIFFKNKNMCSKRMKARKLARNAYSKIPIEMKQAAKSRLKKWAIEQAKKRGSSIFNSRVKPALLNRGISI